MVQGGRRLLVPRRAFQVRVEWEPTRSDLEVMGSKGPEAREQMSILRTCNKREGAVGCGQAGRPRKAL